jgi:DUF4097 and DUF4098 domain-containing protein YvlB
MSAYPPPPPPGGSYPPPYSRSDWKAQRRTLKMQARMQRAQMRMQMRGMRRGSIVGPLVLLTLGVMFLLTQMGRLSWSHAVGWYGSWWPVVMIAAGVVLLVEWSFDQHRQSATGTIRGGRTLGSGVVFLLIFLAFVGVFSRLSTRVYDHSVQFENKFLGHGYDGFDHLVGDRHDADDSANATMPTGGTLIVRNPRGDVTVTGSSEDGQVHVSVHKQAWALQDSDAENKEQRLQPTFSSDGSNVVLSVAQVDGGQADLTVEMPRNSALALEADRGDINVSELHAAVSLSANHGDVELNGITGAVTAHINDDDATLSAHSITGATLIEGRMGDVTVSDIGGEVGLEGDFFGTTHVEHVNGTVRFESSRTHFEIARLDGDLEINLNDLQANEVMGPLVLRTRYGKNITLERVQGSMDIINIGKGSVSVTTAAPVAPIKISNQHGSVDVGLPEGAGFALDASTGHGEMENDFGLLAEGEHHQQWLKGQIGGGGSPVSISTTSGDVTVRKSVVAPLAPQPPAPPKISPAPDALKAPKAPHAPKAPVPPKEPSTAPVPKPASPGVTF